MPPRLPHPTRRLVLAAGAVAGTVPMAPPFSFAAATPASTVPDARVRLHIDENGHPASRGTWLLHLSDRPVASGDIALYTESNRQPAGTVSVLAGPTLDPQTGLYATRLALPAGTGPGRYRLEPDGADAVDLLVSDGLWQAPLSAALRSFYLQRCGVPLNDPQSGLRHRPCHTGDGTSSLDATGGWHDGGVYGKSVAACTYALGMILGAFTDHPAQFTDGQARIPESGNGRPDALDEAAVGLDWLMRLQRPDGRTHGGVEGGDVDTEGPSEPVMPHDDTSPRHLRPATLADTARASAALALGARVFRPLDAAYADRLRDRAGRALRHLEDSLDAESGPVSPDVWPARVWALAEGALLSGTPEDHARLAAAWGGRAFTCPTPADPSGFAVLHRLSAPGPDPRSLVPQFQASLEHWARERMALAASSAFGIAEATFAPESNLRVAATGAMLAAAEDPLRDRIARSALTAVAADHLHYLLGRNATGRSFVSAQGRRAVTDIAHPMAVASGVILPGFLVSGPNTQATDDRTPPGRGAASHADHHGAIDSNAPSLAATSALVALLARLNGTA